MTLYIRDYMAHIDDNKNNFEYYTFTPRPLYHGDRYKMNEELSAFLIEADRNI